MTQQTTRKHATIDTITGNVIDLLDDQPTTNTTLKNTTETEPTVETLDQGTLLYKPDTHNAAYEVTGVYEDDYGNTKVRTRIHSSDHRNTRTHSYFENQLGRTFAFITTEATETTTLNTNTDTTSTWEPQENNGQATLTTPANNENTVTHSSTTETNKSPDTDQTTLFQ